MAVAMTYPDAATLKRKVSGFLETNDKSRLHIAGARDFEMDAGTHRRRIARTARPKHFAKQLFVLCRTRRSTCAYCEEGPTLVSTAGFDQLRVRIRHDLQLRFDAPFQCREISRLAHGTYLAFYGAGDTFGRSDAGQSLAAFV